MNLKPLLLTSALVAAGLVLAGCDKPVKVTGGGQVVPYDHYYTDATFTLQGDSCDVDMTDRWGYQDDIHGQFTYLDRSEWVKGPGNSFLKIKGDITDAADCSSKWASLSKACWACELLYEGKEWGKDHAAIIGVGFQYYAFGNPHYKDYDRGWGVACVVDNGEGVNAWKSDLAAIHLKDGPFGGYTNMGEVQGNIQEHECDGYEHEYD